jgi:aarF domain-containing kinase
MFGRRLKLAAGSIATLGTIYSFNNVEEEFTGVTRHFATVYTVGKIIRNYKNIEQFASKSDCHLQCAHELLDLFKRNGGVYVKIGQHMSSLVHLIPQEYTDTMQVLQNACLASSYESLNRVFKEDYGKDIESVFKSFDKTPIGVASLAQVHRAEYQIPGTSQVLPVAVKIQHSYLKKQAEIDIKLCELLSDVVKKIFPGYELDWLASETAINLPLELSFENEHKNTLKCQENFKGFSGILIPKVYYSSPRILIMQFEQGCKITDLKELELMNVDGRKVSYLLFKIYNEMIFKHNFVHCDPHPGNLLVQKRQRRWYQLFDTRNFNIVLRKNCLTQWITASIEN